MKEAIWLYEITKNLYPRFGNSREQPFYSYKELLLTNQELLLIQKPTSCEGLAITKKAYELKFEFFKEYKISKEDEVRKIEDKKFIDEIKKSLTKFVDTSEKEIENFKKWLK